MFIDHQISILEWFLKDHIQLKTEVMTAENVTLPMIFYACLCIAHQIVSPTIIHFGERLNRTQRTTKYRWQMNVGSGHETYKVVILINNLEKILSSIEVIHSWPENYLLPHPHKHEGKERAAEVCNCTSPYGLITGQLWRPSWPLFLQGLS